MNESKLWEIVEAWEACCAAVHGVAKGQIWLKTELLQELSCKAFIVSCLWIISKLFLLLFFFYPLATWCEELTHWKRLCCWERLGQEEKGTTEDEMAGWHHRLDGHEFEWTPGVGDGQGGLACCNSWGRKESDSNCDWTELNWTVTLWKNQPEKPRWHTSINISGHECMVWLGRSADLAQTLFLSPGLTHASAVTGWLVSPPHDLSSSSSLAQAYFHGR